MTPTITNEYRDLELRSSNDLMEADSRRALGRYEEAAWHALNAGNARLRMGQIKYDSELLVEATEDWLSAAACYVLASDPQRAEACLQKLIPIGTNNKLPPTRQDLWAELNVRTQEVQELGARVYQFRQQAAAFGGSLVQPHRQILDFALRWVKELPGDPQAHYLASRQAEQCGMGDLALEHLRWAVKFDPDNSRRVAMLGYEWIKRGRLVEATQMAETFLQSHSDTSAPVRLMLAHALASNSAEHAPDQPRAIKVLEPLLTGRGVEPKYRIAALVLSAAFCHELGRDEEFRLLLEQLSQGERGIVDPDVHTKVWELRRLLPSCSLNGAMREPHPPHSILPDETRRSLFERTQQLIA